MSYDSFVASREADVADNTIALELHGSDFVLDDLGTAVEHFRGLLSDLATEVAEGVVVT